MNNEKWIEHLSHWKAFLETKLSFTEDDGEKEKVRRQLSAIESVRYSAVLNPQLLIEFINPITQKVFSDEETKYNLALNESQRRAVNSALNCSNSLSLIQGPPGTGKTQVITEICLQLCQRDPDVRILVCSETHVAVNNLIHRIAEHDSSIRCMRIRDKEQSSDVDNFSPKSVMNAYQNWLESVCENNEIRALIAESIPEYEDKRLEKALALSANVVGMTCNRIGAYQFADSTEMFDYAIIDEVCKATLPEILMPLVIAKKAVLVGDPKQLPPIFCSEDQEVIRAIENCDLQKYMYIDELFARSDNTMVLDTQYRMEKSIGTLIGTLFYDGQLKNGRNVDINDSILWIDYSPSQMWPEQYYASEKTPIIRNLDEARIINQVLSEIDIESTNEKEVAIIVPYRNQVTELRKVLQNYKHLKLSVDTVDGFQGKEADIVVFGITRTTGSFRFLADPRRFNVALSRAKDQVIIVGNKSYAQRHPLLTKVLSACKCKDYSLSVKQ